MALAATGVKCWTACPRGLGLLVHLRRPAQTRQSPNLPDPDVLAPEKAEELGSCAAAICNDRRGLKTVSAASRL